MERENRDVAHPDQGEHWTVGRLAGVAGVSVRTLRHYDRMGLLTPVERTSGGHRLYDRAGVTQLYRILALRRLGFGLSDIGAMLGDPQWDLGAMMARHASETERQAATAGRLAARLRTICGAIDRTGAADPADLATILEDMAMLDTPIHSTTSLLVYDDIAAAHAYLTRTFGLPGGPVERDDAGTPRHAEVYAGEHAIWLHPAGEGYVSPRSAGATTAMTVVAVEDADVHFASCLERGAMIVEEPVSQDYGVREWGARDPEGHLWYFQSPEDYRRQAQAARASMRSSMAAEGVTLPVA